MLKIKNNFFKNYFLIDSKEYPQFATRVISPTVEDFTEFGKIALKYRDQVDQFFK